MSAKEYLTKRDEIKHVVVELLCAAKNIEKGSIEILSKVAGLKYCVYGNKVAGEGRTIKIICS